MTATLALFFFFLFLLSGLWLCTPAPADEVVEKKAPERRVVPAGTQCLLREREDSLVKSERARMVVRLSDQSKAKRVGEK